MALTYQDVVFQQGTGTTTAIDASANAQANARRVVDFSGYAYHLVWTGTPKGTMQVQVSCASVLGDQLVAPANWVSLPSLALTIGMGTTPATSPSLLEVTFGRAGWTSLLWVPSSGSVGSISCKFDGVRR